MRSAIDEVGNKDFGIGCFDTDYFDTGYFETGYFDTGQFSDKSNWSVCVLVSILLEHRNGPIVLISTGKIFRPSLPTKNPISRRDNSLCQEF
jgi:hypothetical protein